MEADGKAQRNQMDNMLKASMKQAEEDRRAFMQENQTLNQELDRCKSQIKRYSKWWRVLSRGSCRTKVYERKLESQVSLIKQFRWSLA